MEKDYSDKFSSHNATTGKTSNGMMNGLKGIMKNHIDNGDGVMMADSKSDSQLKINPIHTKGGSGKDTKSFDLDKPYETK